MADTKLMGHHSVLCPGGLIAFKVGASYFLSSHDISTQCATVSVSSQFVFKKKTSVMSRCQRRTIHFALDPRLGAEND
jgi:hypothetical protein